MARRMVEEPIPERLVQERIPEQPPQVDHISGTYLFQTAENMCRLPGDYFNEFAWTHAEGSIFISKKNDMVGIEWPSDPGSQGRYFILNRSYQENEDWEVRLRRIAIRDGVKLVEWIIPSMQNERTLQLLFIYKKNSQRIATYQFLDFNLLRISFKTIVGEPTSDVEITYAVTMKKQVASETDEIASASQ